MRGPKRRLRGEGSIWLRGDGRYGASARVVVDGIVRRKQITKRTKEDIVEELRRLQRQGIAASGKGTFGEWLDEWLIEVKGATAPKTYESYESVVRLRLKPTIGERRLSRLEPKHVAQAIAAARNAKLSSSTVAYVRTVARVALERALEVGRVTRNVAKLTAPVKVEPREIHPFTDVEFAAFMKEIDGDRLEAAYLLAVLLGPRKGEILGLQWRDIIERTAGDATVMEIRIARQVQRVAKQPLLVRDVKSKRSRRAMTAPDEVAAALRRHRVRQLEERIKAGAKWRDTGHVFTTGIGTPLDPRKLLQCYYGILDRAKLDRRSFHALRHETATAMLVAGVPLKSISALLGHSSERFTQERYAHLVPALEAQVTAAANARAKRHR